MRLEFEPNVTTLPLIDNQELENVGFSSDHDLNSLLKRGIAAAQKGNRDEARKMLSQAAAIDPQSEDAWMWLASISEYPEELLAFLDRVLNINPENARAVEWRQATRSLLAKTFVQRAVSAKDNQSEDMAAQCLDHALSYDARCEAAWFLKASWAESEDEKVALLERVLSFDRKHKGALEALASIHRLRSQAAFDGAKQAAVAGDHLKAIKILDTFLEDVPDSVEAWTLKSHLSPVLEQKIEALEKALEIDPENAAARSGLAFLALTFGESRESSESARAETVQTSEEQSTDGQSTEPETSIQFATDLPADETDPAPIEFEAEPVGETVEIDVPQPDTDIYQQVEFEGTESEFADEPEAVSFSPAEPARSVEELFGPLDAAVDADQETVESLAPFIQETFIQDLTPVEHEEVVAPTAECSGREDAPKPQKVGDACPFCSSVNNPQVFECGSCRATLSFSDIEALMAGRSGDREIVQDAVTRMEAEWNLREFDDSELTALGIGHFNLGNSEAGLKYLQEASRLDPNNVILAGQVNAIAIRLDEIRRQNEVNEAKPTGKTILVVDDSPTVRKLISGKLEKSGHVVVCAADGVEALEHLENGLPDLVLLDITMPRMDGYEVCKQIRANPIAKYLPVVMISGKDGFFDKVRGRMAGSTGYVTKPFGPETLMKALETYLIPEA